MIKDKTVRSYTKKYSNGRKVRSFNLHQKACTSLMWSNAMAPHFVFELRNGNFL